MRQIGALRVLFDEEDMSAWNPEELKRLIAEHSVVGYKVETPFFKRGTIKSQIRPQKGGFIFYNVVADKPIPFNEFARMAHLSTNPLSLKQWKGKVKGTASFPAMAYELRERLEQGGKVSPADVDFQWMSDTGCIDIDQNVFCYTFRSEDVFIVDPQPGQLVEVSEGRGPGGWPGRFLGFEDGVAIVEQFAPVSYMRTPEALLPEAVKLDYALPVTQTLAKGLVHMLEDLGATVPPGAWSEDEWEYELEAPIRLGTIQRFCESREAKAYMKANLGGGEHSPQCLQQAMVLHTLPLVWEEVSFRPLPEGTVAEDVVVSIAEINDPEAQHIVWPAEEREGRF